MKESLIKVLVKLSYYLLTCSSEEASHLAFNKATTGDFGNNGIGHGVSSFKLARGTKRYQNTAKNSKAKSRPKAQM